MNGTKSTSESPATGIAAVEKRVILSMCGKGAGAIPIGNSNSIAIGIGDFIAAPLGTCRKNPARIFKLPTTSAPFSTPISSSPTLCIRPSRRNSI